MCFEFFERYGLIFFVYVINIGVLTVCFGCNYITTELPSQGDVSKMRQNSNEITNNRGVSIFMPSLINGVTIDGVTQLTLQN